LPGSNRSRNSPNSLAGRLRLSRSSRCWKNRKT
jgi:hypothetical protein